MQDGAFVENLTVRETLYYAAKLRLASEYLGTIDSLVESIISTLRLGKVADSRVGDMMDRGISGGEQRRLAIGTEMILSPSLLFMDEPTTGLDALNSMRVLSAMRELCRGGHTIITTIHQPRSDIFKMFDYLLLLDAGKCVYYGPAQDAANYFSRLGYTCPQHVNPADFLLDVLDDDEPVADLDDDAEFQPNNNRLSIESSTAVPKSEFAARFQSSVENEQLAKKIAQTDSKPSARLGETRLVVQQQSSLLRQFWVLLCRTWVATLRDPGVIYVRTIAAIGIGLLVGTIFYGQPPDERSKDARINSTIFLMTIFALFSLPALTKYIKERLLFHREVASGYYSAGPYFIASQLVEIPLLFVVVVVYVNITYWMIGLDPRLEQFFFLLALVFVVVNIGFAVAQLVSSVVSSMGLAIALYMVW